MISDVVPKYFDALCNSLEKNYYEDEDVKSIIRSGITPLLLLKATKLVREKENSPLIKLNWDISPTGEENFDSIDNLEEIVNIACLSGTMKVTLDCIENAKTEAIMLKVQAPFSALMMLVGSTRMFRWICKYPKEMHKALGKLTESTADYCLEAISRGTSIISLADPSGIFELLGENRYKEFAAFYVLDLLNRLNPYLDTALVHICPRTSVSLQKLGLITTDVFTYERENYANTVLELSKYSSVRIMGHRCINAETTSEKRVFVLKLNTPQVNFREMKDKDWDFIADIYNEGISSGTATIVKTLPTFETWKSEHGFCLVAEYLGNIVGFAAVNRKDIPEISIYIASEFQNRGIGTSLLTELLNRIQRKLRSLIFENNTASIRLHEKLNFINSGSFRFEEDERLVREYEWSPYNA